MEGRCFCGSVQFKLHSDVKDAYYCHCRDCQIQSGGAFHALGVVDRGAVEVALGSPAEFAHKTASGFMMTREFCAKCGTPLFLSSTRFPQIKMFMLSALIDSELIRPTFQIWCSSKPRWPEPDSELDSFPFGESDEVD